MENVRTFQPGETVIREGGRGTSAFIILSGAAEVFRGSGEREVLVATLERGQVFGEMGLIEDRPRPVTVKALTEIQVMSINRDRFNELLSEDPSILVPVMKSLFERLRQLMEAKAALADSKRRITKFPFLIGRDSRKRDTDVFYLNDLFVKEERPYLVSRNHMAISHENGGIWVVDRGSAFGTIVNGKEIGRKRGVVRVRLDQEENQVVLGPATSRYIFLLTVIPKEYPPWRNP